MRRTGSGRVWGDGKTLNHIFKDVQRRGIALLWKQHGGRGRPPESDHQKLKRLASKGVNISSILPLRQRKLSPLAIALIEGGKDCQGQRAWTEEMRLNFLRTADKIEGANKAAKVKNEKNAAIINAYKEKHKLKPEIKPSANMVAEEFAKFDGLSAIGKQNLRRRLKRTGLAS